MTFAMPDRGLLTVREVAAAMRVSTMTVYRLIKAGELPAIRVGKHFRIKGGDLTAYLDSRIVVGDEAQAWAEPGRPQLNRPSMTGPHNVGDISDTTGANGAAGAAELGGSSWPGA